MTILCIFTVSFSQEADFVTRSNDTLKLSGRPFYCVGTNAYYLFEQAARGDSQTVKSVFQTANSLGMRVVRTWGFFDSPDSSNRAVIQYRPGVFSEQALRALDYVLYQARVHNIRLLIPFVNNWDDYGGMNQYVRWRAESVADGEPAGQQYSASDLSRVIDGGNGRLYSFAVSSQFGHDHFYTDELIRGWFKNYILTVLNRVNTYTNVRYKDDPFIFGWELANEPRSSDRSAQITYDWISEMAAYVKSIDQNHLVGTGEEGFDTSPSFYSHSSYGSQNWLFDGSAGISFSRNCVIQPIDFASCHLYPESWGVTNNGGNQWISDHVRLAQSRGKAMMLGEFGVREQKPTIYESWLNTALLDGASGALVWQLLEGQRTDGQGFGFRCWAERSVCSRLHEAAGRFDEKSRTGFLPIPSGIALHQNYPNPCNGETIIAYSLPVTAYVNISLYNTLGQRVATVVDGMRGAGKRKELFGENTLASGSYFYTLVVGEQPGRVGVRYRETKKLVVLR